MSYPISEYTGVLNGESIRSSDDAAVAKINAITKAASVLTGFDREDSDSNSGKLNGIQQYCHLASSGEVHNIGSDESGTYTLLTGQTHFADGTILADRTLMMYHDTGETSFSYWRQGILVEVEDAKFLQVDSDFKGYVGFNAAGELDNTVTDVRELIVRTPLTNYLYLNGTEGTVEWFADERHGIVMDGQTHLQQHQDRGFFIANGLDIHGIVNNGTTYTGVDSGNCGDEDIKAAIAAASTAPKLRLDGAASEWIHSDDDNKFALFVGAQVVYNDVSGTPTLTPIGSDRVVMTLIATNNKLHPLVWLVGQELHATRGVARARANSSYWRIRLNGLPSNEFRPVCSVIINNESTGTAEVGGDGEIFYDHRFTDSTMRFEGDND